MAALLLHCLLCKVCRPGRDARADELCPHGAQLQALALEEWERAAQQAKGGGLP